MTLTLHDVHDVHDVPCDPVARRASRADLDLAAQEVHEPAPTGIELAPRGVLP